MHSNTFLSFIFNLLRGGFCLRLGLSLWGQVKVRDNIWGVSVKVRAKNQCSQNLTKQQKLTNHWQFVIMPCNVEVLLVQVTESLCRNGTFALSKCLLNKMQFEWKNEPPEKYPVCKGRCRESNDHIYATCSRSGHGAHRRQRPPVGWQDPHDSPPIKTTDN